MEHIKWTRLVVMAALSFVVMYALMYVMVDTYDNVVANRNQLYMAMIMTAGMMVIEIILMRSMYSRKVVITTMVMSIVVGGLFFGMLRSQAAITDKQFLKSMIPHHGAALLMCGENTTLTDQDIKALCASIVAGQQAEIDWMQKKLQTLQ